MANLSLRGGPNAVNDSTCLATSEQHGAIIDNADQQLIENRSLARNKNYSMDANDNEWNWAPVEDGLNEGITEEQVEGEDGEEVEEVVWEDCSDLASDEEWVTDDDDDDGEEGEWEEIDEEDEEDEEDEGDDDDDDDDDDDEEEEEDEEEEQLEDGKVADDGAVSGGDDGKEQCPICLCPFCDQEVGTPESCDHTFCFECILEWSKNVTTCPVDRSVFSLILVRNTLDGEVVRQVEVKVQEAQEEDDDPTYCEACGECDREDRLLLCDGCDAGYHCECLTPPLDHIPVEEWFCPNCVERDQEDESSEDEYMANLRRPLRRVREYARAIARTQVAERVLARVNQLRALRQAVEESEAGPSAGTTTRAPTRRKTTTRKRKTKRKTTKRKTTKKKTGTKKKTRKKVKRKTTSTTTKGKKRRKVRRRRKRKTTRQMTGGARTAKPAVQTTIRSRIANRLNLVKPKVGSMMPDVKAKGEHSLLGKRHDIGVATLSLTGGDHLFDPSGNDEVLRGPGEQSAPTPVKNTPAPSSSGGGGVLDLLGSIMQGQSMLHMRSSDIKIHRDGTLSAADKQADAPPRRPSTKPSSSSSSTTNLSSHHTLANQQSSAKMVTHSEPKDEASSHTMQGNPLYKYSTKYSDLSSHIDDNDVKVNFEHNDDLKKETEESNDDMDIDSDDSDDRPCMYGSANVKAKRNTTAIYGIFSSTRKHSDDDDDDDGHEERDDDGDTNYQRNDEANDNDSYQDGGIPGDGDGNHEDGNHGDEGSVNNNNNNNSGEGDDNNDDDGDGARNSQDQDDEEENKEEEEEEEEQGDGDCGDGVYDPFNPTEEPENMYGEHEEKEELEPDCDVYDPFIPTEHKEEDQEEAEYEDEHHDGDIYDPLNPTREPENEYEEENENDNEEEEDLLNPTENYSEEEGIIPGGQQESGEAEEGNMVIEKDEEGEEQEEKLDGQDIDIDGQDVLESIQDERQPEEEEQAQKEVEKEGEEMEEVEYEDDEEQGQAGLEDVHVDKAEGKVEEEEEEEVIEEIEEVEEEEGHDEGKDGQTEEVEQVEDGDEDQEYEEVEVEVEEEEEDDAEKEEEVEEEIEEIVEVEEEEEEDVEKEEGEDDAKDDEYGDEEAYDPEKKLDPIGDLECEDISEEENDELEESDPEEGMLIEMPDGQTVVAKHESTEEQGEEEEDDKENEEEVKHGPSSEEEGEVKTDDEGKKGKKVRKRRKKKKNRDRRNVIVDPRKSISILPPASRDPRLAKREEERREGSRETFKDLRHVIQVKRDTPYTAEELRRYHEEYWEEYNRRRDERRVERSWEEYSYHDQCAYYEMWRNMGGEAFANRQWALHVQQQERSPMYDRRKKATEAQGLPLDPRLEARQGRKELERAREEAAAKKYENKNKGDQIAERKDTAIKIEKSQKDTVGKVKSTNKGHVHENAARDKNGREPKVGSDKKKQKDKGKENKVRNSERDKENRQRRDSDRGSDRGGDRDRSRKNADNRRERHNSRDRSRENKENKGRDRHRSREKSREKDRSRDRRRSRERDRSREKERRDRHRSRERSRERDRSREQEESRDRSRRGTRRKESRRSRSRDSDRRRSRHQSRSHSRHRSHSRSRHRSRSRSRHRSRSRSRSRGRNRSKRREKSSDSDRWSGREKKKDKLRDKGYESSKKAAKARDRDASRERERERKDSAKVFAKALHDAVAPPKPPKEKVKIVVQKAEQPKVKETKKVLVAKGEKVKGKKLKKDKAVVEGKPEKKVKKIKTGKKLTKGKKKKAAAKRPLSFDVDEISAPPPKKSKAKVVQDHPVLSVKDSDDMAQLLKPPSPLRFDDDVDDNLPSTTRSSPDLYIDAMNIAEDSGDNELSSTLPASPKQPASKPKSPTDIAAADSSHLDIDTEGDMYDPFNPTASPPSGIRSPSPIVSDTSPPHDTATSSSVDVVGRRSDSESPPYPKRAASPPPLSKRDISPVTKRPASPVAKRPASPITRRAASPITRRAPSPQVRRAKTPPTEPPPNPTSTTDVSSSDMATLPPPQQSQLGLTNEARLLLASQASQQITKILNQLASATPIVKPKPKPPKPRISPESPTEEPLGLDLSSPKQIGSTTMSVSSMGSEKIQETGKDEGGEQEEDIEESAVDLYNKNSRDRYLKKLYHQERVVEEVKLAIKPHYQRKVINKEDYKEILKKAVNQICHSKTGEINPVKIRRLIDGYVKKVQHRTKKGDPSKSKGSNQAKSKTVFKSKEPASASKLIEKSRSHGLKSNSK